MNITVMGLTGEPGAGKDTAIRRVVSAYPELRIAGGNLQTRYNFSGMKPIIGLDAVLVHAFADPLKAGASLLLGIPLNKFNDRDTKDQVIPEFGKSTRAIVCELSDAVKEVFGPNVFTNLVAKGIERLHQLNLNNVLVIFTDVRFEHEEQLIRKLGGAIVEIVRNTNTHAVDPATLGHNSTHYKPSADWIVENNGDIQDLQDTIEAIMAGLCEASGATVKLDSEPPVTEKASYE